MSQRRRKRWRNNKEFKGYIRERKAEEGENKIRENRIRKKREDEKTREKKMKRKI